MYCRLYNHTIKLAYIFHTIPSIIIDYDRVCLEIGNIHNYGLFKHNLHGYLLHAI